MKRIPPFAYLVVLIGCLIAAYFTWTRGPSKSGGMVPILECGKGELRQVTVRQQDRQVVFSQRSRAGTGASLWWVNASTLPPVSRPAPEPKTPDELMPNTSRDLAAGAAPIGPPAGEPAAAETTTTPAEAVQAAPAEVWTVSESFQGNEQLGEELAGLCPWEALRSLGKPDEKKLGEFGLKDTKDSIVLEVRGKPRRLLLGTTSLGPGDRYIENEGTGEVFLVGGQSIRGLLYPKSRFMERSLHGFKEDAVARVRISAGNKRNELLHRVSETGVDGGWAQADDSSESKELYGNWVQKLFSLSPTDYVIPEGGQAEAALAECKAPPGTETAASMTFFDKKQEIGFLTIYRTEGDKAKAEYTACTENTGAAVKLTKTQAEGVLKDMEDVL